MQKKGPLYLVNCALATGVMYYVLDLSKEGRTVIDLTVIGLVSCAILWSLIQLGRRLHWIGGTKDVWHLLRTITFWVVGWFNTALIRPEDTGTWKNWLGWALLVTAALDTVALFRKEWLARENGSNSSPSIDAE